MIPESETSECLEHEVKSKIENIFLNEKILEEYSVKAYEIDSYFYEHCKKKKKKKKMQVDKNGDECISFRIDLYFTKCCLAIAIAGQDYTGRDLTFEEKRQKALEKKT